MSFSVFMAVVEKNLSESVCLAVMAVNPFLFGLSPVINTLSLVAIVRYTVSLSGGCFPDTVLKRTVPGVRAVMVALVGQSSGLREAEPFEE